MGHRVAEHAVVLGGSMAGVLAARVLADHVRQVTVVDRDRFPPPGQRRRGVPQDRHVHALQVRGWQTIQSLFPGVDDDFADRGVAVADPGLTGTFVLGGHRVRSVPSGPSLTASRPLLEGTLRERLCRLPNVAVLPDQDVHGLDVDRTGDRVTGVRLLPRANGSAEEILHADVVVDATGRGSRLPQWLDAIGHRRPEEDESGLDVTYTSARFPRDRGERRRIVLVQGPPPDDRRGGAAIAVEGDSWVVTLVGVNGEQAPRERDAFVDYAASLSAPDLHGIVNGHAPLCDLVVMRYPSSRRRRYELLDRFPERLVVLGDSLCSFNPIYGQGMTVAALEALALGDCLAEAGIEHIGCRFLDAVQPVVDDAWDLATGEDRRYLPDVAARQPWSERLAAGYRARVQAAAAADDAVARRFLEVMTMLRRPRSLLHPAIATRVVAATARRRTAPPA